MQLKLQKPFFGRLLGQDDSPGALGLELYLYCAKSKTSAHTPGAVKEETKAESVCFGSYKLYYESQPIGVAERTKRVRRRQWGERKRGRR